MSRHNTKRQPDGPQVVEGKQPATSRRAAKSPEPKALFSALPKRNSGLRASKGQVGKIAKHKASGVALRDSEARYRRLFETAQDGILILDAKTGMIMDVNPFLVKLLDYSRAEFLGKALWEIGLFRDIEASKITFRELQTNKYVRYEDLPLKTKSGRSINVEFVSNVYGVNNKKVIQCNIRDITQRKYAERAEQLLGQAQKMEAVGQLAGGMAHDFNNLLSVILGYCEILEGQLELTEPARKMVVEIHNAGTSAKDLTLHLLSFSRRKVFQPLVCLDLNATVSRVVPMLSRLIGSGIELVSGLGSDLGTIKADQNQIEQVLMNLVVNARDAMVQGGKITIETANVEIDESCARQFPSMKPGIYVMLAVSDTGIGMDEETKVHIFEPFFSTKEAGKGTGLGLATVCGIVKQSDGFIRVDSKRDHGTTFSIYFPRREEMPPVIHQEQELALRGGSETILLVEDTASLRKLTRRLLEDCGYKVLDAENAAEATRIAGEHEGLLPLLITDVVLPGISGLALAEKVAETRPKIKILYISGSSDQDLLQTPCLGSGGAFLEKPFTRDALVTKVRELLDSLALVSPR